MDVDKVREIARYAKQTLNNIRANSDKETISHIATVDLPYLINQFKELTGTSITDTEYININSINREQIKKIISFICDYMEKYLSSKGDGYIKFPNAITYRKLIDAISTKDFKENTDEAPEWPQKILHDENGISHIAKIMPAPDYLSSLINDTEEMQKWKARVAGYILTMNDETADVMDIITSAWLEAATSSDSMLTIHADEILKARGLTPRKSGVDKRVSTYKLEDRQKISNHIHILSNTWINVVQFELPNVSPTSRKKPLKIVAQSPAITIDLKFGIENSKDGKLKEFIWRLKPGSVFADYLLRNGRNTLLQSQKALSYNYHTQKEEKRLTRFLAWEWGVMPGDYTRKYKVSTLLDIVHKEIDKAHPSATVERIEAALDRLHQDNVIKSWSYEKTNNRSDNSYKWVDQWLNNSVIIQAPDSYIYEAKNLTLADENPQDITDNYALGIKLKNLRNKKGLTLRKLAEELEISKDAVHRAEKGLAKSEVVLSKIREWVNKYS